MPKMKTKKALAKRVKISATGKVLRKKAYTSHLAQNKTKKQKRHLAKKGTMNSTDLKRLTTVLPK